MNVVKIFISHNSKYVELAASLKNSLHALEIKPSTQLDVRISEEMEGASNWRQWIEDNVRSADIFLLLFPNSAMDMSWCNYELGRFYAEGRKIVCLKNTDIANAPPPFQPYQAYDGDEAGIRKFIDELFVKGTFTDNRPLNPKVGLPTEETYGLAQNVARQLARKFAQARLREQFYEARIVLSVRFDAASLFDPETSSVAGNVEGMKLLGFTEAKSVSWSDVRRSISDPYAWPSLLERAIPLMTAGSLTPTLPPFLVSGMIYNPVIMGARSVDGVLKEVVVSLVWLDKDRLRSLVDWSPLSRRRDAKSIREGSAFVAMAMSPNDPSLADVLDAIKEGTNICGIKAERIDDSASNDPITQRMLLAIETAEYVIADLTNLSANVSYEAGYAHGLGKIPIYLARNGANIPFDIKDYPIIFYSNMRDLKARLARRLQAIKIKTQ